MLDAWLSEFQIDIIERFNIQLAEDSKLLQAVYGKRRYVLHFTLLQLHFQLGMRIAKLHGVLQFHQDHWMETYINLNSNFRKSAINKFQQNYYKLMTNSVYGKTIESKKHRLKLEITRNAERAEKIMSNFEFERFKIFWENWWQ